MSIGALSYSSFDEISETRPGSGRENMTLETIPPDPELNQAVDTSQVPMNARKQDRKPM
jgi:hypothetical protein